MTRSSVLFPHPDGPKIAVILLAAIRTDKSTRMGRFPRMTEHSRRSIDAAKSWSDGGTASMVGVLKKIVRQGWKGGSAVGPAATNVPLMYPPPKAFMEPSS